MAEKEEIVSWDEALTSGNWIKLEQDETKVVKITNWKLVKLEKFGQEQVEFQSDVLEEDGKEVEKFFTTTSNRLKTKLKGVLVERKPTEEVKLSVLKVGDKFSVQYSIKEVK